MPTPTGMAKKGDIVRHASEPGRWRVVERCGNDAIYAVKLVPLDGQMLPLRFHSRGYMLVTEFPHWLKHGWSFG